MEPRNVEITTQVIGEPDWSLQISPVWMEFVEEEITLEKLIARTVEMQINELLVNRSVDLESARRILNRQYMSQEDIQAQLERTGGIQFPSERSVSVLVKHFNVEIETKRAFEAFESGRVVVFVDGKQMEDLGEVVTIGSETKVKFIRLTPLKGG